MSGNEASLGGQLPTPDMGQPIIEHVPGVTGDELVVPGMPPVVDVARNVVPVPRNVLPVTRDESRITEIPEGEFKGNPTGIQGHPSNPNSLQSLMNRSKPGLPEGLMVDSGSTPDGTVTGGELELEGRTAVSEITYGKVADTTEPAEDGDEAITPSEPTVNNEALDKVLDSMGGTVADAATGPTKAVPPARVGDRVGYFAPSTVLQQEAATGNGVDLAAHDKKYMPYQAGDLEK